MGRVVMPGLTVGPPDAEWIGPYLWWWGRPRPAEALGPFAQVIGGYTRCDSNRDRKITADAGRTLAGFHPTMVGNLQLKAGLHWLRAAEWAAGAAAHGWSRVSGLRVCNAGSSWVVGGGRGT